MQEPQLEPELGPGGLKQEVWFAIAGGAVILTLLMVVVGVFVSNSLGDSDDDVTEAKVKIAEPDDPEVVLGPSQDDTKQAIMEIAKKAGWEYEWKDSRETDIYDAAEVIFSNKNRRIGLIVYWSDNNEYLDSVDEGTESPDVAMRFMGALLIFSPLPGQEMSEKLLDAFRE